MRWLVVYVYTSTLPKLAFWYECRCRWRLRDFLAEATEDYILLFENDEMQLEALYVLADMGIQCRAFEIASTPPLNIVIAESVDEEEQAFIEATFTDGQIVPNYVMDALPFPYFSSETSLIS